jgi:hypothetical protein
MISKALGVLGARLETRLQLGYSLVPLCHNNPPFSPSLSLSLHHLHHVDKQQR